MIMMHGVKMDELREVVKKFVENDNEIYKHGFPKEHGCETSYCIEEGGACDKGKGLLNERDKLIEQMKKLIGVETWQELKIKYGSEQ